jgi:hypothetical protein
VARLREWGGLAAFVAALGLVVLVGAHLLFGSDPDSYCRAATRGYVDGQITYNRQVNGLGHSLGAADVVPQLNLPTRERFEALVEECVTMRVWERPLPVRDEEEPGSASGRSERKDEIQPLAP